MHVQRSTSHHESQNVLRAMRRVVVIGPGGAGKSTLARRLSGLTGLPLVHLDSLYWHPGWRPTPRETWEDIVASLTCRDAWIMDGNYGGTLDLRLAACDTVVFLDVSRVTCVWRLLRRRLENIWRPRTELPPGCPERLTWEFLAWVWTYPTRRRPAILERLSAPGRPFVSYVLRSRREVSAFLAGLGRGASADMAVTSSARLAPDSTPRGHDHAL